MPVLQISCPCLEKALTACVGDSSSLPFLHLRLIVLLLRFLHDWHSSLGGWGGLGDVDKLNRDRELVRVV